MPPLAPVLVSFILKLWPSHSCQHTWKKIKGQIKVLLLDYLSSWAALWMQSSHRGTGTGLFQWKGLGKHGGRRRGGKKLGVSYTSWMNFVAKCEIWACETQTDTKAWPSKDWTCCGHAACRPALYQQILQAQCHQQQRPPAKTLEATAVASLTC